MHRLLHGKSLIVARMNYKIWNAPSAARLNALYSISYKLTVILKYGVTHRSVSLYQLDTCEKGVLCNSFYVSVGVCSVETALANVVTVKVVICIGKSAFLQERQRFKLTTGVLMKISG